MTQNSNSTPTTLPTARKTRRATPKYRPVLVSSTSLENSLEVSTPENNNLLQTEPLTELEAPQEVAEEPVKTSRARRLPSFFSKVEKGVEEPEVSQEEVAKARLARARKSTGKVEATPATSEDKPQEKKVVKPAQPPKLFKTRHFIGMMIYLFGAELILPYESNLFTQWHIERTLASFSLFNLPMTISSSTILNLVTLVVLLILLVKWDLLPRSFAGRSAATQTQQQRERQPQANMVERQPQPTIRQGVKGENDDLYLAYRESQRRNKKS